MSLVLVTMNADMDNNGTEDVRDQDLVEDEDGESDEVIAGTFELIQRIQNRRFLFDLEEKRHQNKFAISDAWTEVAVGLKIGSKVIDGDWCKKKWKSMTDYYRQVKQRNLKKSGEGRGKTITWPYYSHIHEILQSCKNDNERTVSNMESEEVQIQSIGSIKTEMHECVNNSNSHPIENENMEGNSTIKNLTKPSTGRSRKKKSKIEVVDDSAEILLHLFKEAEKDEDEEFHFAMVVASRLRQLSPRSNRMAQMDIQQTLFGYECPEYK